MDSHALELENWPDLIHADLASDDDNGRLAAFHRMVLGNSGGLVLAIASLCVLGVLGT